MNEVFVMLFIALLGRTVLAINCYSCESTYESKCGEDNFEAESHFKLDCGDVVPPRFLENEMEALNSTACMKKIYIEEGERKVVRSCFFGEPNSTMSTCGRDPTLDPVEEISCDICDNKSLCNSANDQARTLMKSCVASLALFVIMKLFNYFI